MYSMSTRPVDDGDDEGDEQRPKIDSRKLLNLIDAYNDG